MTVAEYLQLVEQKIKRLEKLLISQKNVLTFDEGASYMGVSHSCLYKMTMTGSVPHYKPRGKMIYFDRAELEQWLLQNRITTAYEIEAKAATYVAINPKNGR
ncbi:MAG: helix-turn-helix domain-containing protein [Caedimonadaceae bacterium]|nr:MAG: helix-turn-helix domain-containing protein [Caedimonadaceae bacterium]